MTTSVVATIRWNDAKQWSFVRDGRALTLYDLVGELPPNRIFAWDLQEITNYQQFLLVLLQKFHQHPVRSLPETVNATIAVQNAFARAQLTKTENVVETD